MQLSADSVIQRNSRVVSSEFDGETVMMDTSFEKYFGMKAVGTRVWQLLEEPRSVHQLCETLTTEYEVSYQQCLEDVLPFLQELSDQQMIEQHSPAKGHS